MFSAASRFVRAVHAQARESHVVIMYQSCGRSDSKRWKELPDREFQRKVMMLLANDPHVINARFSAPDSYDDWTFTAYRRPPKIDPGHCMVCNHHAIDYSHTPPLCHNICCEAEQTPQRIALWIDTPKLSWWRRMLR